MQFVKRKIPGDSRGESGPFRFSGGRQLNRSRRVARHVPFRASKLKNLRESWPREHLPLHRASLNGVHVSPSSSNFVVPRRCSFVSFRPSVRSSVRSSVRCRADSMSMQSKRRPRDWLSIIRYIRPWPSNPFLTTP